MANEVGWHELRRRPRSRVSWPGIVEANSRRLLVETLDVGPFGAKVRLAERLEEGTLATLHLTPPGGRPVKVQTIVWRSDTDGPALFFLEAVSPASTRSPSAES